MKDHLRQHYHFHTTFDWSLALAAGGIDLKF